MTGNRARDERRRKARWNREHGARRVAAISRELKKRHARGDYRPERRRAYKAWLALNAEAILAEARREVSEFGEMRQHPGGILDLPVRLGPARKPAAVPQPAGPDAAERPPEGAERE
jgi:hypothetical protein